MKYCGYGEVCSQASVLCNLATSIFIMIGLVIGYNIYIQTERFRFHTLFCQILKLVYSCNKIDICSLRCLDVG